MSRPPWHLMIDTCLATISRALTTYLESQEFKEVMRAVIEHRTSPATDIYEIKVDIDNFIINVFPIKTKTTEILEHVFLSAVYAQLNTITNIFLTYKNIFPIANIIPMKLIVQETLDRSGRNGESPLYRQVCDEYMALFQAATKIQRQWRLCITHPSYVICQRRLLREYIELRI